MYRHTKPQTAKGTHSSQHLSLASLMQQSSDPHPQGLGWESLSGAHMSVQSECAYSQTPHCFFLHPARQVPLNFSWIFPNTYPKIDRPTCPKQVLPSPANLPSTLLPQSTHKCYSLTGWLPLPSGLWSNFCLTARSFLTTQHETEPDALASMLCSLLCMHRHPVKFPFNGSVSVSATEMQAP